MQADRLDRVICPDVDENGTETGDFVACGLEIVRTESRFTAAIGFAVASDADPTSLFILAVSPYWVIDSDRISDVDCSECGAPPEIDTFVADSGLLVTVGAHW